MLLMCYVKEPFASSLATLAAVIHYLHSVGLEQTLGRYGLVSSFRLQKLTEIAYVGLILKLASDIDAGMASISGLHRLVSREPQPRVLDTV